jgi:hypothetical protein
MSQSARVVPPVDLDTPVTNPRLVAAISSFAANRGSEQLNALLTELNSAVYLVATILDEANISATDTPGNIVFEAGSLIKVVSTSDADGNGLLPLFTDWDAIQQFTPDPVQTLVMPASDAWAFALDGYDGVVLNPAGSSLPLSRTQVEVLREIATSA